MFVGASEVDRVLAHLSTCNPLSLDTETSGLRPYHGDAPFSVIISDGKDSYYFDLREISPSKLTPLLSTPGITWFMHNATFDLSMLHGVGLEVNGQVHCTKTMARLEYNEYNSYKLADCAERIGDKKDDTPEKYIKEHRLWEWRNVPGKKCRTKHMFYDRLPKEIIVPYAEQDALVTHKLGVFQQNRIKELSNATPEGLPTLQTVCATERSITKVCYRMEQRGIKIDRGFCMQAARHEANRAADAAKSFEKREGRSFVDSAKVFEDTFESQKALWRYTEKANPRFDTPTLETFSGETVKYVLEYRDAKARSDFFNTFLYHADANDFVHPNFNSGGTATGRFSSSNPNFQNLSKEPKDSTPFPVRRAIIPREDFSFLELDYKAMEFRVMVDYAGDIELAGRIREGEDPHAATASMVGIDRRSAKTLNFALVYNAGPTRIADMLKISQTDAKALREQYFGKLPKVKRFLDQVVAKARTRGFIFNRFGRRCFFPDPQFAYKAPNYLIQGSCGDALKTAMVKIDAMLEKHKSRMILTVHDSLLFEIYKGEDFLMDTIKSIMESAYPHKHLPMECSVEYSKTNWGDLHG